MEFYFEMLINPTKDIKINQQLLIFNHELSGNKFSKSQSCVIMDTVPLDSLILSHPFLSQNAEM